MVTQRWNERLGVAVTHKDAAAESAAGVLADYFETEQWEYDREEAFPHQQRILQDIFEELDAGHPRGFVESPTSTGKTYLIAKLTEIFYNADLRVLILTRTKTQANQIVGDAGDRGLPRFAKSIPPESIGRHYKGLRASSDQPVAVSTYAGLNRFSRSGELGQFDVILADEAHRSLGHLTSANLQAYCPEAIKLGFTATPRYSADKRVEEIFDHAMHEMSLKEAIENDLVAPLTCLIYTTSEEIPYFDNRYDYTQRELTRLITLKSRNAKAVEFAKNFISQGRQGVIVCVPGGKLAHARELARDLNGDVIRMVGGQLKFIRAEAVGNFQSDAANSTILRDYENGLIDVLTYVDSIGEGWDSTRPSFSIDLCPTTSLVRKKQRVGRILRRKPGNLESIAVDFMDISPVKPQISTLDVLDERHIVLGKSYRSQAEDERRVAERRSQLQGMLSSELWFNLLASDAVLLNRLRLRFKTGQLDPNHPLVERWEKILAKEGLPSEPPNSLGVPKYLTVEIGRIIRRHVRVKRELPTEAEIYSYMDERGLGNPSERRLLARLAIAGFVATPSGLVINDDRYESRSATSLTEVEDEADENIMHQQIRAALDCLPERERRILELRFGLTGKAPRTLEAIGRELDLQRERVRQLEDQALTRLAHLRKIQSLDATSMSIPGQRALNRQEIMAIKRAGSIERAIHGLKLDLVKAKLRLEATLLAHPESQPLELVSLAQSLGADIMLYSLLARLYIELPAKTAQLEDKLSNHTELKNRGPGGYVEAFLRRRLEQLVPQIRDKQQALIRLRTEVDSLLKNDQLSSLMTSPANFNKWLSNVITETHNGL